MKWGHGITSDKLSAFCLFNESPIPNVPQIYSHKHISYDNYYVQISGTTHRKIFLAAETRPCFASLEWLLNNVQLAIEVADEQ